MEIMKWVANQVQKKSRLFNISLAILGLISMVLVLGDIINEVKPIQSEIDKIKWDWQWLLYFPWIGTISATICIWLHYAPIVVRDLARLKDAFKGEEYKMLYDRYQKWMMQEAVKNLVSMGK